MIYQSFNKRMIDKLANVVNIYSGKVFEPITVFEKMVIFQTKEHLRKPPKVYCNDIRGGETWGGEFQSAWLGCNYRVPDEYAGKALYLCQKTGAKEILVFVNEKPVGMLNCSDNFLSGRHDNVRLTDCAKSGDAYRIDLECYAWHYEPGLSAYDNLGKDVAFDSEFVKTFQNIQICVRNDLLYDFVCNLKTVLAIAKSDRYEFLQAKAIQCLEEIFPDVSLFPDCCVWDDVLEGIARANQVLANMFTGQGSAIHGRLGIIGHSHLDTAWLWPMDETIRKDARTISTAVQMMKQFPEYKFLQPAVLHTAWLEKHYPDIFEDVKQFVAEGRYEPNGAVWVECDCNMTGGEFMVRQFLKGQLYLEDKFGYHADCFWLPDTFGYSAAIPQIMKGFGVKYFYTTKMDWNEHNRFPYETFIWKGIDGSSVITHLNGMWGNCSYDAVAYVVNGLQNKTSDNSRLNSFGIGDGGGGPTDYNLEETRRVQKVEGLPEVYYTTISEFGKQLEEKKEKLPVYNGELYLELHRGTLTQMHDIKRNNRKAEVAIHNMEALCVMAGADYEEKQYDAWVKLLLQNQFHDILPGTGLYCVNQKSVEELTKLMDDTWKETVRCGELLVTGEGNGVTMFNTLSFTRCDPQHLACAKRELKGLKNQWVEDVMGRKLLAVSGMALESLSGQSFAYVPDDDRETVAEKPSPFTYDGERLETPYALICFDNDGYLASYIDKPSGREVRREGAAPLGTLYMGEDIAVFWDNWDVEYDQKFKMKAQKGFVRREVVSAGPVEMRLRSVFRIGNASELVQDMIVYADSPRVDFQTKVDWKDKHQLLKVGFDVDVLSTTARHEIQFGHLERPTTENDSFEAAKFEVCNHKWTDLSESRFGVAVLNDCKYGISVRDSNIRLSLHRGGCRPDPTGDFGVHEFTYSLLVHQGAFDVNRVVKPAYELNLPVVAMEGVLKDRVSPLVEISAENVLCETVKPSERCKNQFVLRLYEAERTKTVAKLHFSKRVKKVWVTDMMECQTKELELENHAVTLTFKPFEIQTLLCEF